MIISFHSIIDNDGKKQEIKFSSQVTISKYQNFDVYEFREPSQNQMNRIEIATNKINIIAGPSTIELELKKKVNILYSLGNSHVELQTFLKQLENKNGAITFAYSIMNKEKIIGNYKIRLIIK